MQFLLLVFHLKKVVNRFKKPEDYPVAVKVIVKSKNPRNRAIWEGALGELELQGLVTDAGHKREVFQLTRRGYEIAEIINP